MIGDGKTGDIKKIAAINQPTLTDEITQALRGITEKRATTLTYLIDKAHENDQFARDAVWQYGLDNGIDFKEEMERPDNLEEFADKFTNTLEANVYEMETVRSTSSEFEVHFHYCPYVNRWLKMGKNPQELGQLCDICMLGDKATASIFSEIDFHLGDTIAKGNSVCELRYRKHENSIKVNIKR
ncbi:MAG: L-2-amino-thiazoline-4-carboxylic acid hydrolase [Liquorilactobacillus nagelii]|jgi:hypothetical protein|uniref:L-2-amino-thiazoline-4-carboxylic acid hydrolase n=1 Tax=Liquorilactobacillus nagelii TaxID=82688 RepID=UPI0024302C8B|nr:L-2-amino-thiazoline-4-carboxylic acid hydrolase [Liquorilactobacillus nagelii]MCI1632757.1 L-2-amino-thiazoline-4-carboxylic acid hydrolase [Liquorilactobacillus nagelii]MCI1921660.1 L-2-amino-thiazoline-4-carboxylic acid hydrolase [Liquorilactobacillus nagelii]MCI1976308.1 L-2-amino-thiazoline-4-carboxylic acid hydrolase [Liquorilactobacillus nagelii]